MVAPGELCHTCIRDIPTCYPDGATARGSARPSVTSFDNPRCGPQSQCSNANSDSFPSRPAAEMRGPMRGSRLLGRETAQQPGPVSGRLVRSDGWSPLRSAEAQPRNLGSSTTGACAASAPSVV